MENSLLKFFQTVFQSLSPPNPGDGAEEPAVNKPPESPPSLLEVGKKVSRPGPVPDPKHRMSDSEFMAHLNAEAERLNHAFREAAMRDIDPHPVIEAVTEADEFEDLRRIEIIRLQPTKLLPTEDGVEELEM